MENALTIYGSFINKTPYKGILKLEARLAAICMSTNLYICAKFGGIDAPLL